MRKIMMIVALAGLGFAGSAKAGGPGKAFGGPIVSIPSDKREADLLPRDIVRIKRVGLTYDGPYCLVEVKIELPSGEQIQMFGDDRPGKTAGRLNPVLNNGYSPAPELVEAGRFARVGQSSIVLEINGENGLSVMGLFVETTVGSRLEQAMNTEWMVTDGEALYNFDRDIATAYLPDDLLIFDWQQARGNAGVFLAHFVNKGRVPDSVTHGTACSTNCGGVNVPARVYPNGGGYGPHPNGSYLRAPQGSIDQSLFGR